MTFQSWSVNSTTEKKSSTTPIHSSLNLLQQLTNICPTIRSLCSTSALDILDFQLASTAKKNKVTPIIFLLKQKDLNLQYIFLLLAQTNKKSSNVILLKETAKMHKFSLWHWMNFASIKLPVDLELDQDSPLMDLLTW